MMDEDMAWLIVVCGLMGSIIVLIEQSGGGPMPSESLFRNVPIHAKEHCCGDLAAWHSSVFIDDYLSILTVASCMKDAH